MTSRTGSDTCLCDCGRMMYYDYDTELWRHIDDNSEGACDPGISDEAVDD